MTTKKLLTKSEVKTLLRIKGDSTLREWMTDYDFPLPLKTTTHRNSTTLWWLHEIEKWLEERSAARGTQE